MQVYNFFITTFLAGGCSFEPLAVEAPDAVSALKVAQEMAADELARIRARGGRYSRTAEVKVKPC